MATVLIVVSVGNFVRTKQLLRASRVIFTPTKIICVRDVKNVLKNVPVGSLTWLDRIIKGQFGNQR